MEDDLCTAFNWKSAILNWILRAAVLFWLLQPIIIDVEKSEANDSIFHTTGLGKLPHTILTIAADDQRGRSDLVLDSVVNHP